MARRPSFKQLEKDARRHYGRHDCYLLTADSRLAQLQREAFCYQRQGV
jgi:hypothetical protein